MMKESLLNLESLSSQPEKTPPRTTTAKKTLDTLQSISRYPTAFGLTALLTALAFAGVRPCWAQQSPKLRLNGYLTQAFGMTDGNRLLGLDEDGTTDYRTGALLFTFNLSGKEKILLQLSHESIGDSPIAELGDDVELDWAFYQRRFGSGTRLRVGRLPIPYGIYNELRDVGPLLEFYRPPFGIYFEAAFTSETVDGAAVAHTFGLGDRWSLDAEAYLGSWDRIELINSDTFEGRAEDAFGTQLWLNTPVDGLRFGLAAQRFDQEGMIPGLRGEDPTRFEILLLSIDASFSKLVFRAEAQHLETSFLSFPHVEIPAYYVLLGYKPTPRLAFYALYEESTTKFDSDLLPSLETTFYDDLAFAATYAFTPQAVLRLEVHDAETAVLDEPTPFGAEVPSTTFGILSLSTSF